MEALMRQKMSLQDEPVVEAQSSSQQTFLEVCGAYQNGPFQKPTQRVFTSATSECSVGGQTISALTYTNININLMDQGVLYDMKQTMFVGLITLRKTADFPTSQQILKTIRNCFATVSWKIGNITGSNANHEYLSNIKHALSNRKKMAKVGGGLICAGLNSEYLANVSSVASRYTSAWKQVQAAHSAGQLFYEQVQSAVTATEVQYIFGIPLHLLLDLDIPNGVLYLGLGQNIQIVLRNVASNVCLGNGEYQLLDNTQTASATGLASNGYALSQMGLLKVYTELDQNLQQKIQSVSLQMPIYKYLTYPIYQISGSNISLFNIGKNDRIRRFLFSMNPLYSGTAVTGVLAEVGGGAAIPSTENIVTSGAGALGAGYSTLSYPMTMIPAPIYQIQITVGAWVCVIPMQQIKLYQRLAASLNNQDQLYQNPLDQQLNYAYGFDLTRFEDDIVGAMGLEQSVAVQVQILLQVDGQLKTIMGQKTGWTDSAQADTVATIKSFQFQTFLEIQNMKECRYGIYQ